jgi:LuxR family quorum sensing-dependent transcriptional regulator
MQESLRRALEFLQNAQDVTSLEALTARFGEVVEPYGFSMFQYCHLATPGQPLMPKTLFGKPDTRWNQRYREGRLFKRDPALSAIFANTRPFTWSDIRATASLEVDCRVFDDAAELGLHEGLVIPIHGPHGSVAGLQIVGADPDLDPALRPTLHALGMMYGTLGLPLSELAGERAPKRGLSPREKECLLWAARGKSDWDTGMILGLSERTVSMHCDRARARLGARTRIQALATALRLGWITADEI